MNQVYNPYLPLYEYVPDGEPHVFGNRLYIYGSHDFAGGNKYCLGDYVAWSAPLDDLSTWRYDGVIYKRTQDPTNEDNFNELWAPDVCQGLDGRYYMYYCLSFVPEIGVAVSDSPAGPFEFYGHVKYPAHLMNGKVLHEHLPFDPAIFVDDDQKIFLYYGFSPLKDMADPADLEALELSPEELERAKEKMSKLGRSEGGMVVELEPDMLTMKAEPQMFIPGGLIDQGTEFEGHGFFEASSMRKVNGMYYFVYSSKVSHELCYATSTFPNTGFHYGGVLVSNGDIGYQGNTIPMNMMGNNHGGMIEVNRQWYIFYHRHTHGTESSRQGCAEPIFIHEDGSIDQVEMTSCGLNDGPLKTEGRYLAPIACNLICEENRQKITYGQSLQEVMPYIYEEPCGQSEQQHIHYIANITNGTVVGYKYFEYADAIKVRVTMRGNAKGIITVKTALTSSESGNAMFQLEKKSWQQVVIPINEVNGVHGLFFDFHMEGNLQLKEFEWVNKYDK